MRKERRENNHFKKKDEQKETLRQDYFSWSLFTCCSVILLLIVTLWILNVSQSLIWNRFNCQPVTQFRGERPLQRLGLWKEVTPWGVPWGEHHDPGFLIPISLASKYLSGEQPSTAGCFCCDILYQIEWKHWNRNNLYLIIQNQIGLKMHGDKRYFNAQECDCLILTHILSQNFIINTILESF